MLGLIILGVVVLSAVVAWKLHKKGSAVTVKAVVAGDEAAVKSAANTAVSAVANTVAQKL